MTAARFLLVVVFVVAGWAKLSDPVGTRIAVVAFGVPEALGRVVAALLPIAELTVAGLLLFADSARWGALGAAVLLVLFVVGMVVGLVRGRRPDCHCFGQVRAGRVGAASVLRNLALIAIAAFVIAGGRGATF